MTENELKTAIKRLARLNGWAIHDDGQERTMHRSGDNGYPDLTLARDGEVVWIETKDEIGALSPAQLRWRLALPAFHLIRPSDFERGRVNELLA